MRLFNLFQIIEKGGSGSGNRGHVGIPGHLGGSAPQGGIGERNIAILNEMMASTEGGKKEASATIVPDETEPMGFRISRRRIRLGNESSVMEDGTIAFSTESGVIHSHPVGKKFWPSDGDVSILSKISKKRQGRGWHFGILEIDGKGKPKGILMYSGNKGIDAKTTTQLYSLVKSGIVKEKKYKL